MTESGENMGQLTALVEAICKDFRGHDEGEITCFRHFFLLVFFLADYQQISILNFGDLGNAT